MVPPDQYIVPQSWISALSLGCNYIRPIHSLEQAKSARAQLHVSGLSAMRRRVSKSNASRYVPPFLPIPPGNHSWRQCCAQKANPSQGSPLHFLGCTAYAVLCIASKTLNSPEYVCKFGNNTLCFCMADCKNNIDSPLDCMSASSPLYTHTGTLEVIQVYTMTRMHTVLHIPCTILVPSIPPLSLSITRQDHTVHPSPIIVLADNHFSALTQ